MSQQHKEPTKASATGLDSDTHSSASEPTGLTPEVAAYFGRNQLAPAQVADRLVELLTSNAPPEQVRLLLAGIPRSFPPRFLHEVGLLVMNKLGGDATAATPPNLPSFLTLGAAFEHAKATRDLALLSAIGRSLREKAKREMLLSPDELAVAHTLSRTDIDNVAIEVSAGRQVAIPLRLGRVELAFQFRAGVGWEFTSMHSGPLSVIAAKIGGEIGHGTTAGAGVFWRRVSPAHGSSVVDKGSELGISFGFEKSDIEIKAGIGGYSGNDVGLSAEIVAGSTLTSYYIEALGNVTGNARSREDAIFAIEKDRSTRMLRRNK